MVIKTHSLAKRFEISHARQTQVRQSYVLVNHQTRFCTLVMRAFKVRLNRSVGINKPLSALAFGKASNTWRNDDWRWCTAAHSGSFRECSSTTPRGDRATTGDVSRRLRFSLTTTEALPAPPMAGASLCRSARAACVMSSARWTSL